MPSFRTQKQVAHSADKMFALVADIERYPEFLPMCESLTIRSRREQDGNVLLVADMSVGYKLVRESFTTQVYLQPKACRIDVQYIDGPFKYLQNRWQFLPVGTEAAAQSGNVATEAQGVGAAAGKGLSPAGLNEAAGESCIVDFYIDYAFKNPMLSMLMGAMFDIAFRKFTAAFITRADKIYGVNG